MSQAALLPVTRSLLSKTERASGNPVSQAALLPVTRSFLLKTERASGNPMPQAALLPVTRSLLFKTERASGNPVPQAALLPVTRSLLSKTERASGNPMPQAALLTGVSKKDSPSEESSCLSSKTLRSDNLVCVLEVVALDCLFPHLVLEDLTCCIHRESFYEVNVSRDLVLGHVGPDIILNLFLG